MKNDITIILFKASLKTYLMCVMFSFLGANMPGVSVWWRFDQVGVVQGIRHNWHCAVSYTSRCVCCQVWADKYGGLDKSLHDRPKIGRSKQQMSSVYVLCIHYFHHLFHIMIISFDILCNKRHNAFISRIVFIALSSLHLNFKLNNGNERIFFRFSLQESTLFVWLIEKTFTFPDEWN